VTNIGNSMFYACYSLSNVEIPNSVTKIENIAFGNCSSLTSVTIPNSITSIRDYAFNGTNITSLTIPNSVIYIGVGICGSYNNYTKIYFASPISKDIQI